MAVPTVLLDTDVGAPALSGTDGALYNVLKWALPLLGWTIEFDDAPNFKIVFRNSPVAGSGVYLRVNDLNSAHASNARHAQVHLYTSMTDIDTGANRCHPADLSFWSKSRTAAATVREWKIVGTNRFFYFFPLCNGAADTQSGQLFFAGDCDPAYPGTGHAAFTANTLTNSLQIHGVTWVPTVAVAGVINDSRSGVSSPLDATGGGAPAYSTLRSLSQHTAGNMGIAGVYLHPILALPEVGKVHIIRGGTTLISAYLPGLFSPNGNWSSITRNTYLDDVQTPDGIRRLFCGWANGASDFTTTAYRFLLDESGEWHA